MNNKILNIIILFLINIQLALSQGLINNGANIVITNGANIVISEANSNFINSIDGSINGIVNNEGIISLDGNFINNASNNFFLNQTNNGLVVFNNTSAISGNNTNFASITINGSLTGHATNMNVAGNWINNGTFNHNYGTVTFKGNTTMYGSQITIFKNIIIADTLTAPIDNSQSAQSVLQLLQKKKGLISQTSNSLSSSSGQFNIEGDWINNGVFNHNNGTINFNGITSISGSNITSFNNINISSGAALKGFLNGNINVSGDWTNNGTYDPNSGTITFNGTTTLYGSQPTNFNNIIINGILNGLNSQSTDSLQIASQSNQAVLSLLSKGLQINSGLDDAAGLSVSNNIFNVAGNWINNGTFNHNNGTVSFNGISNIGGVNITSFNNVNITSSGALKGYFNGNFNVSGDWRNCGFFAPNSGTITFNGNSTIYGAQTTNFNNIIITGILNGTGNGIANQILQQANTSLQLANKGLSTGLKINSALDDAAGLSIIKDTFNVAGNWTNNGTFNHNNGMVVFNGNSHFNGTNSTTFYNVNIAPAKFLTINGGGQTMQVQNKMYVMATDPHNMGQLVIADNTSKLTGAGGTDSVFVQVYDTLNNWHYQSTPFYNGYMGAMAFHYFYGKSYNEKTNAYVSLTGFDSLQAGRGYALKYNTTLLNDNNRLTTLAAPISKLHAGTISLDITNTVKKGDGWNLVGNPYPCAIDWEASQGWNCKNIDPTIYLYDASQRKYAAYNSATHLGTNGGSRYIPPMQGLYVHCTSNGQWSMDNRVRVVYNQPFWKGETQNEELLSYQKVKLTVNGNGYSDESIVAFSQSSTTGFDVEQDAYKLLSPDETVPQINTKTLDNNNLKLAMNFLPSDLEQNTSVPVDFTVGVAGIYTISLNDFSTFNPSVNITLEDMKTKTTTDMRTSTYKFTSDVAVEEPRFVLHFSNAAVTGIGEKNNENSIKIYSSDNFIYVQNTTNSPLQVMVFDLQGKQVIAKNTGTESLIKIEMNNADGIYVVKVFADNKTYTQKLNIRRVALLKKITNPDTQVSEDNIDIIDDKMIEENK